MKFHGWLALVIFTVIVLNHTLGFIIPKTLDGALTVEQWITTTIISLVLFQILAFTLGKVIAGLIRVYAVRVNIGD